MIITKKIFFSFLLVGLFLGVNRSLPTTPKLLGRLDGEGLSLNCKEESFIISSDKRIKKKSKNAIKEDIGMQMKGALHCCVQLNKQICKIQMELSDIQKHLFDKVGDLIDNKPPFKKAKKGDLASSFKIMQNIKYELESQVRVVKNMRTKMNNDTCLKKTG